MITTTTELSDLQKTEVSELLKEMDDSLFYKGVYGDYDENAVLFYLKGGTVSHAAEEATKNYTTQNGGESLDVDEWYAELEKAFRAILNL